MSYKMEISKVVPIILLLQVLMVVAGSPRPDPQDAPAFARWLISESSWGVLATLSPKNIPFGNVLSFTDSGTGEPLFYESTKLDLTGKYATKDPRASFAVTEYVLGFCGQNDPQFPLCGKLTLSGTLVILDKTTPEGKRAEDALITRHPQFAGFPKAMGFDVFKLVVEEIYLVNLMAPYRNVSVADYLSVSSN